MSRALNLLFLAIFLTTTFAAPPQTASDERIQLGLNLYQKGEYDKAISQFEKLTGDKTIGSDARAALAQVYLATGEYEKAEKVTKDVLATHPQDVTALTLLGDVLAKTGHYPEAKARYQRAIAAAPDYLPAHLGLGELQWQLGEKSEARTTLEYFVAYYRSSSNLTAETIGMVAQACVYLERFKDANNLFFEATKANPNLWQAYLPWGELMVEKYNTSDAQGIFEDALKINPNLAEAHLGLASASRMTSFERATTAAEKALEINPNLVAAHDFLADLDIAMGRFEEALDRLQKPLEVNPNSLTSRSLKAVAYYFLNDDKRFQEAEAGILSISPTYGDLYFQIAEVLGRRYLFKESVEFYRKAIALDPQHWAAHAGLGTSLSRLGNEVEAKQVLEKAFAHDPYNKYVGNLLTLFDEFPEYKSHKTKYLTVLVHEEDNDILAPYAVELADESFANLLKLYPIEMDEDIFLEIFPSHDDFAVRCFGLPGAEAFLGICFGNVVAMDSPRARSQGDFDWGETMWHELVHVTHLRLTGNRIPRWLAEGIAVYETSKARPYWSMNMDWPFILAFLNKRTLPLKDLDSGFNRPTTPGQVTLSYFQASLLVEFIVSKYGHDKILETFPHFKKGLTTSEVIQTVFGKNVDAFDSDFQDYVRQKYRMNEVDYVYDANEMGNGLQPATDRLQEQVEEKPNNPYLNFRLGYSYYKNKDYDNAVIYLQKAKQLFPDFVDRNNPYRALADIYANLGQPEKAIAELKDLTARNGKDLETLQKLTTLCMQTNDFDGAIQALQKAIYIAPFEPDIHQKLASAYMARSDYKKAIYELQMHLLAGPQDLAAAHCDLAAALLKDGQKAAAKKSAMAALEIAPSYERAQEILLSSLE